jgi:hypothetical protein
VAVVAACILVPSLQRLFQFEAPSPGLVGSAALAGICAALVFDLAKLSPAVQHILGRVTPTLRTENPS